MNNTLKSWNYQLLTWLGGGVRVKVWIREQRKIKWRSKALLSLWWQLSLLKIHSSIVEQQNIEISWSMEYHTQTLYVITWGKGKGGWILAQLVAMACDHQHTSIAANDWSSSFALISSATWQETRTVTLDTTLCNHWAVTTAECCCVKLSTLSWSSILWTCMELYPTCNSICSNALLPFYYLSKST